MQYDEEELCERCLTGTALSSDRTLCLKTSDVVGLLDPHCNDSVIPETPVCNTCEPGYRMQYGKCIACSEELIENGCLNCHPQYPDKCLMCDEHWI